MTERKPLSGTRLVQMGRDLERWLEESNTPKSAWDPFLLDIEREAKRRLEREQETLQPKRKAGKA